jgi:hypothetical protein
MQIPSALIGRTADLEYIVQHTTSGGCCSLVGVSNLGKSALLRRLCDSYTDAGTFVYIDCNRMPERTARAFLAETWRALGEVLTARLPETAKHAQQLYDEIVNTSNAMTVALKFQEGLSLALDRLPRPLVLCFDEFDESYQGLEPQAFLNLRSFKDRYDDALVYVTATECELDRMTKTREQGEFQELVAAHVHYMHFMEPDETRQFCDRFAEREEVTFSRDDLDFIRANADGHPGLVQAVCYALGTVTGAPTRDAHQDRVIHQVVQESLAADPNVRAECEKIWNDLETDERDALSHLSRGEKESAAERRLKAKYIVRDSPDGPAMFSRLFADFVRKKTYVSQPSARGVYVDVDAGAVWVDGKPIEGLTDLEYRLVLFLYGRLERVCDKYGIVEAVWGEDYVDNVDDARIEKLISRVRQKIEPDPAHPRYLQSLRGRGYKLVR